MRVIAGSAKGVRLAPVPPGTRPVSDRAREGLFSSLGDRVREAIVLDLFAGTGAMGIEALSRGAASCTFVERSSASVKAIRANLEKTHLDAGARVVRQDVAVFLKGRAAPATLVILDPPYAMDEPTLSQVIGVVDDREWLDPAGWAVALTRASKGYTPVIPVDWVLSKRLDYGDNLLVIFREAR